MTMTDNQNRLAEVLFELFKAKEITPPALSPDTVLEGIGLESLDYAQAVIQLEEITGKDPFAGGGDYQIRTLADFAAMYD